MDEKKVKSVKKSKKVLRERDEEKEKRTIFVGNLPNDSKKEVTLSFSNRIKRQ